MKELTREIVREISADIMSALEPVAEKHGIKLTYKGGSFTSSNCTYRIEAAVMGADGQAETRERENFTVFAARFGLDPSDLGVKFKSPHTGEIFEITGLAPRRRKFPVSAIRVSDRKGFKFPAQIIKMAERV